MTAHDLVCGYCDAPECSCLPRPHRVIRYLADPGPARALRDSLTGGDLWRYEPLLPASRKSGSALAVGGTPLLDLGSVLGARVRVKDETRNPSGSLKDRATEVALAVAREQGYSEVITASTGNAGASLACVAAAQGMRAKVVVPASAPKAKLGQIIAYGAELVTVPGGYDDAYDHAIEQAERTGAYCRNTGVNPYTREGKKTCAFEIAEQLGWTAPSWVVVPCGDGNVLSGIGTGFRQLAQAGCLDRLPRLVAAQVESSDSITRMFTAGGAIPRSAVPVRPSTVADSISVGLPRDHVGALRALRDCDGVAISVPEASVRPASSALARGHGLWLEPSSAVAWAALERLLAEEVIRPGEDVVLVATGTGLKDPWPWG